MVSEGKYGKIKIFKKTFRNQVDLLVNELYTSSRIRLKSKLHETNRSVDCFTELTFFITMKALFYIDCFLTLAD